eukprot:UN10334
MICCIFVRKNVDHRKCFRMEGGSPSKTYCLQSS